MITERCFSCGRKLGKNPALIDTRDDQLAFVGRECYRLILAAGAAGYQPLQGGPRLYALGRVRIEGCHSDEYNGRVGTVQHKGRDVAGVYTRVRFDDGEEREYHRNYLRPVVGRD